MLHIWGSEATRREQAAKWQKNNNFGVLQKAATSASMFSRRFRYRQRRRLLEMIVYQRQK